MSESDLTRTSEEEEVKIFAAVCPRCGRLDETDGHETLMCNGRGEGYTDHAITPMDFLVRAKDYGAMERERDHWMAVVERYVEPFSE